MNDIDDLRAALRRPPAEPFAEPDLARIMADGGRIRRRRKLVNATGALAAAAAVVAIVVFAVQLRRPAPIARPALPAPTVSTTANVPSATLPPEPQPLGDVVLTGVQSPGGEEMVLYAIAIDQPVLKDIHFGLVAGYRDARGSVQALLETNETETSDRSFGFHATDGGEILRDRLVPVFGYFSGPAAKITTTVHGATKIAKQQQWTEDPTVVFFWFDPSDVPSSQSLTPLVAYDVSGNRLTK
jgi:hypothetical protein